MIIRDSTSPGIATLGTNSTQDPVIQKSGEPAKPQEIIKGELVHLSFNKFCRWVNGYVEGEEKDKSRHNFFCLRDLTKAIWPLYLPLQLMGLVSDKAAKLARAWYGVCWSIVYSCYRPWKENRDGLTDDRAPKKIGGISKNLYKANEYFRVIMGSVVSAIYGGGALGMLWSCFKGDDDLYDKAANVYQTGMMNQNQIFASMNSAIVMKRKLNPNQLDEVDQEIREEADKKPDTVKVIKERVETVDSFLFIPNIITRGLDTLKSFGLNVMNEGVERFVNALGYFSYGTWATRFGIMKTREEEGGDLKILEKQDPTLYNFQKYGGKIFYTLLPGLSWLAAFSELFGFRELAQKVFKLEGICERLNPTIFSYCMNEPWLQGYQKVLFPSLKRNLSQGEN